MMIAAMFDWANEHQLLFFPAYFYIILPIVGIGIIKFVKLQEKLWRKFKSN